ncbi:MAG: spore germination protein, partial [Clostridiales bacterium]
MANIKKSLAWNLEQFDKILGKGPDIVLRRFLVGGKKPAALIFIDGLVNKIAVSDYIILPLMLADEEKGLEMEVLKEEVIGVGGISSENDENKLIDAVLAGTAVFLLDGCNEGLILDIVQWEKRSISEPDTDVVVRGPREGFIETLRINLSLLRRKIHHPALTFEMMKIGRYSKTDICLVYIKGVVNEGILVELKERLSGIKIDGILESGYIEELIEDSPFSLFPTVGSTEKPDIVAGKILEGRVAILVDGTPMALTVPMLFIEGFQCSEDYYSRFYQVSMIRILRYLAFFVNIFLPGIYVSLTTYHQQLIPVKLLLTMAAAEENTPFSVGFSLLLMGFAYEILREAGVRMPRPMGQAVSIVGAIVMGDAAVSAGLISAPVLIVVALT